MATQYQWLRNGVPIDGATSETYTTTSSDKNCLIQLVVRESSGSPAEIVYSNRVGPIYQDQYTYAGKRLIVVGDSYMAGNYAGGAYNAEWPGLTTTAYIASDLKMVYNYTNAGTSDNSSYERTAADENSILTVNGNNYLGNSDNRALSGACAQISISSSGDPWGQITGVGGSIINGLYGRTNGRTGTINTVWTNQPSREEDFVVIMDGGGNDLFQYFGNFFFEGSYQSSTIPTNFSTFYNGLTSGSDICDPTQLFLDSSGNISVNNPTYNSGYDTNVFCHSVCGGIFTTIGHIRKRWVNSHVIFLGESNWQTLAGFFQASVSTAEENAINEAFHIMCDAANRCFGNVVSVPTKEAYNQSGVFTNPIDQTVQGSGHPSSAACRLIANVLSPEIAKINFN